MRKSSAYQAGELRVGTFTAEVTFRAAIDRFEHLVTLGIVEVACGITDHFAAAQIFNEAMAAKAQGQVAGIMAAYDFSRFKLIADIGGGRGHLLSAVLNSTPAAKGVLFDLPHVIRDASAVATNRITLQAGDFFSDALPVCDLYLLMEVIHDWDDDKASQILSAVRRAAPRGTTLLLLESIVPDDPAPNFIKTLDIVMLTLLGGKQRSLAEYDELLRKSGYSVAREIPTRAGISILEASAA